MEIYQKKSICISQASSDGSQLLLFYCSLFGFWSKNVCLMTGVPLTLSSAFFNLQRGIIFSLTRDKKTSYYAQDIRTI